MVQREFDTIRRALPLVGADPAILDDGRIAHVVADGHRILSRRSVPGLRVELEESADVLSGVLVLEQGVRLEQPVYLCFGLAHRTGVQRVAVRVRVEADASGSVLAHCLFPAAEQAQHHMDAVIDIGPHAALTYTEGHFHGTSGGGW